MLQNRFYVCAAAAVLAFAPFGALQAQAARTLALPEAEVRSVHVCDSALVARTGDGLLVSRDGRGWAPVPDPGIAPANVMELRCTPRGIAVRTRGGSVEMIGFDGRPASSARIPGAPALQVEMVGDAPYASVWDLRSDAVHVFRLASGTAAPVLTYPTGESSVSLTAPGAPSLTIAAPYEPRPQWIGLPDGRIAHWTGTDGHLVILDARGREVERWDLPRGRRPVTEADREAWFATLPSEFAGQRVFEPLREAARSQVTFPAVLPRVISAVADPDGGAWVRRTASGRELWTRVGPSGPARTVLLPEGRRLVGVSAGELLAVVRSGDAVVGLEAYPKSPAHVRAEGR